MITDFLMKIRKGKDYFLLDKILTVLKISYFVFCFSFIFFSCSKEPKKPDYLLPKEKFTEVLTEVQIAETAIRLGLHRAKDSTILKDSIFTSLFREMGVSPVVYDSNYNYYLERPAEFEAIFDEVMVNLTERSALLKEKKELSTD